jgi:hypothetical protein
MRTLRPRRRTTEVDLAAPTEDDITVFLGEVTAPDLDAPPAWPIPANPTPRSVT